MMEELRNEMGGGEAKWSVAAAVALSAAPLAGKIQNKIRTGQVQR